VAGPGGRRLAQPAAGRILEQPSTVMPDMLSDDDQAGFLS
jgi:hypothetical protein